MFQRWGHFVARHPKATILASLLLLLVTVPLIPSGLSKLSAEGWDNPNSQSYQVAESLSRDFGQAGTTLWIVFSSDTLQATDPAFQAEVQQAIAPLRSRPEITSIVDYASTGSDRFISRDGRETYVLIDSSSTSSQAEKDLKVYRGLVKTTNLTTLFGGWAAANAAFTTNVERDLRTQEIVSLPITLLLLVFVFGSLVAAGLPLAIGILSIPAAMGGIAVMAHLTDTSIYALNIASVLGLAVSIDYSLFIVTRFREELASRPVDEAVAVALGTTGKAVFFSALVVAVGLIGMVFFPMFALRSLGLGGAAVVALAVFYALTFLPALLALLGPRVNRLRVRRIDDHGTETGWWGRLATVVMRHPLRVMLPVLAILIAAGLPFLSVNFATPGMDMIPKTDEARMAYGALANDFPDTQVSPVIVVLSPKTGKMTDPANLSALTETYDRIAALRGVERIESIYGLVPSGTNATPEELTALLTVQDPTVAAQARGFLNDRGARLNVIEPYAPESTEAKDMVEAIRAFNADPSMTLRVQVGGATAVNIDMVDGIVSRIPYALGFVVLVTYIVLFLLLGSVFLPFKAIIMDALSITASFGVLVWVFQDGHLNRVLGFEPLGYIVPMIPVMMFGILFGLSMDYEVLMLSRMQEEYRKTGDNTQAVAFGLERTGQVITGAALIMIAVFGAAVLDRLIILESLGVGMAVAVFADATIVRALLVPATMRVMGSANWWAPGPLKRLYARAGIAEATPVEEQELQEAGRR